MGITRASWRLEKLEERPRVRSRWIGNALYSSHLVSFPRRPSTLSFEDCPDLLVHVLALDQLILQSALQSNLNIETGQSRQFKLPEGRAENKLTNGKSPLEELNESTFENNASYLGLIAVLLVKADGYSFQTLSIPLCPAASPPPRERTDSVINERVRSTNRARLCAGDEESTAQKSGIGKVVTRS
ncbi:hypothetical protein J6590_072202 [Homalodisca vitripennis]|nr:hypothetical protein J6590_072202 [Homalodisca vitripennis]